jgi:hypothetical protein
VPTEPLRARHERADGQRAVLIEVADEFDHGEASAALARVYAYEPLRTGWQALRDGLALSLEDRRLEDASPHAREAYWGLLRERRMFPAADELRGMRLQLEHALADRRERPGRPRRGRVSTDFPPLWAKTDRKADGHPVVTIERRRYYALDEAARALAVVYRRLSEPWRSDNMLHAGLQSAARKGVLGRQRTSRGPEDLVQTYRTVLLEEGVFVDAR